MSTGEAGEAGTLDALQLLRGSRTYRAPTCRRDHAARAPGLAGAARARAGRPDWWVQSLKASTTRRPLLPVGDHAMTACRSRSCAAARAVAGSARPAYQPPGAREGCQQVSRRCCAGQATGPRRCRWCRCRAPTTRRRLRRSRCRMRCARRGCRSRCRPPAPTTPGRARLMARSGRARSRSRPRRRVGMRDVINKNHTEEELLTGGDRARATRAPSSTSCAGAGRERRRPAGDPRAGGEGVAPPARPQLPRHRERVAARAEAPHAVRMAEQVTTAELNRRLGVLRDAARHARDAAYRTPRPLLKASSRAATGGWARRGGGVPARVPLHAWSDSGGAPWLDVRRSRHGPRALPDRASTDLDQPWDMVQSPVRSSWCARSSGPTLGSPTTAGSRISLVRRRDCPQRQGSAHAPLTRRR